MICNSNTLTRESTPEIIICMDICVYTNVCADSFTVCIIRWSLINTRNHYMYGYMCIYKCLCGFIHSIYPRDDLSLTPEIIACMYTCLYANACVDKHIHISSEDPCQPQRSFLSRCPSRYLCVRKCLWAYARAHTLSILFFSLQITSALTTDGIW